MEAPTNAQASTTQSLADVARHVIECHSTQQKWVHIRVDDVACVPMTWRATFACPYHHCAVHAPRHGERGLHRAGAHQHHRDGALEEGQGAQVRPARGYGLADNGRHVT
jgi:hypothetical protein